MNMNVMTKQQYEEIKDLRDYFDDALHHNYILTLLKKDADRMREMLFDIAGKKHPSNGCAKCTLNMVRDLAVYFFAYEEKLEKKKQQALKNLDKAHKVGNTLEVREAKKRKNNKMNNGKDKDKDKEELKDGDRQGIGEKPEADEGNTAVNTDTGDGSEVQADCEVPAPGEE